MITAGETTREVLRYIKEQYDIEPDFLWEKTPDAAAFRHKGDKKWFGVLFLGLQKNRLKLEGGGRADVINLKCDTMLSGSLIDGEHIFPGYHMNKEHWISVLMDGSVPTEQICWLVDMSYQMTTKG